MTCKYNEFFPKAQTERQFFAAGSNKHGELLLPIQTLPFNKPIYLPCAPNIIKVYPYYQCMLLLDEQGQVFVSGNAQAFLPSTSPLTTTTLIPSATFNHEPVSRIYFSVDGKFSYALFLTRQGNVFAQGAVPGISQTNMQPYILPQPLLPMNCSKCIAFPHFTLYLSSTFLRAFTHLLEFAVHLRGDAPMSSIFSKKQLKLPAHQRIKLCVGNKYMACLAHVNNFATLHMIGYAPALGLTKMEKQWQVCSFAEPIANLACSSAMLLVVTVAGHVYIRGQDYYCLAGNGSHEQWKRIACSMVHGHAIKRVMISGFHMFFETMGHCLLATGSNKHGMLGIGSTDQYVITESCMVVLPIHDYSHVSVAGSLHQMIFTVGRVENIIKLHI